MRLAPQLWIVASVLILLAQPSLSGTCDLKKTPGITPYKAENWRDLARFSFLIGLDHQGSAINMVLSSRFDQFASHNELRWAASKWGSLYDTGRSLISEIQSMTSDVATLTQLCKKLDDATFDDTPFDPIAAKQQLHSIRVRINNVVTSVGNYHSSLKRYANLVDAASTYYTSQNFPPNPDLRIGPKPSNIAAQLNNLEVQWRTIVADVRHLYLNVPVTVDSSREQDLVLVTAQARMMNGVIARAHALSANFIGASSMKHYLSGNYIYDFCPIKPQAWHILENSLFSKQNNIFIDLDKSTAIFPDESIYITRNRWRFVKLGYGYWKIESQRSGTQNKALDVLNSKAKSYPVKTSKLNKDGSPPYTGQKWRCYPTRWPGLYRFSNSFLGEGHSMGRYSNATGVFMFPTTNNGGTLWRIKPST